MPAELEHNIVNLLYSVKGMIESHLVSAEEGRFSEEKDALRHAEQVLRKVYSRTDRVLKITKRLGLILNKDDKTLGKYSAVSLRVIWHQALKLLEKEHLLESIEIIERIPHGFPPIESEENAMKEILYHLAKNAIQAMENRGKLIIRAQIAFSTQEEPYAVITLADTGPGIRDEMLPNLFNPFFTTKSEKEGNGFGLYITKALVLKNRGRIAVSSFEGFGTTFTLEFPILKLEKLPA